MKKIITGIVAFAFVVSLFGAYPARVAEAQTTAATSVQVTSPMLQVLLQLLALLQAQLAELKKEAAQSTASDDDEDDENELADDDDADEDEDEYTYSEKDAEKKIEIAENVIAVEEEELNVYNDYTSVVTKAMALNLLYEAKNWLEKAKDYFSDGNWDEAVRWASGAREKANDADDVAEGPE